MKISYHSLIELHSLLLSSRRSTKKVFLFTSHHFSLEIVLEDRSIAIEAAIVRIMKSRKRLDHNNLIQEVMHSLRMFRPDGTLIKQKIEQLIEREYLERDPEERTIYKYLA